MMADAKNPKATASSGKQDHLQDGNLDAADFFAAFGQVTSPPLSRVPIDRVLAAQASAAALAASCVVAGYTTASLASASNGVTSRSRGLDGSVTACEDREMIRTADLEHFEHLGANTMRVALARSTASTLSDWVSRTTVPSMVSSSCSATAGDEEDVPPAVSDPPDYFLDNNGRSGGQNSDQQRISRSPAGRKKKKKKRGTRSKSHDAPRNLEDQPTLAHTIPEHNHCHSVALPAELSDDAALGDSLVEPGEVSARTHASATVECDMEVAVAVFEENSAALGNLWDVVVEKTFICVLPRTPTLAHTSSAPGRIGAGVQEGFRQKSKDRGTGTRHRRPNSRRCAPCRRGRSRGSSVNKRDACAERD